MSLHVPENGPVVVAVSPPTAKRRRWLLGVASGLAVVGIVSATATMSFAQAGGPGAAPHEDGLLLIDVKESPIGVHTLYQQTYDGVPVVGGFYETNRFTRTGQETVVDNRVTVGGSP